ncbi:MAG TPA: hypothetical protein VLF93_01395 [Candidatus Saccharimonadales bacterium]|nr:hypothetical protein [Candidatus Saccharimonadales bacterium]
MYPLVLFFVINTFLYSWIGLFHSSVPLNKFEYFTNANHYIPDSRLQTGTFSLVNAVAQYDSQWYLKIADKGYPNHPTGTLKEKRGVMNTLLYNFFPLYPLLIAVINFFVRDVQLSAFIISNGFLLASVVSLYFVVSQWFSKNVAIKTILLILLFPFGIFLRGYYSEGLRLLLFIWFCYGLTHRKYFLSSVMVGLLSITSGISLVLLPFFYAALWFYRRKEKISWGRIFLYFIIAIVPLSIWMIFCFVQTGDAFIFVHTRYAWERPKIFPLFYNIFLLAYFPFLPFRDFYSSQIDVLSIWLTICVAFLSKNVLPKVVWLATIVLAVAPLFVQDSVSFARFTIVLFPFFVYIAATLKRRYFVSLLIFFIVGILISSLYFVNWYWIE